MFNLESFLKYFASKISLDMRCCLGFEWDETGGLDEFGFDDFLKPVAERHWPDDNELHKFAWYVYEFIDLEDRKIDKTFKLYALCMALYSHRKREIIDSLDDSYCRALIETLDSLDDIQITQEISCYLEHLIKFVPSFSAEISSSEIFLMLAYCFISVPFGREGSIDFSKFDVLTRIVDSSKPSIDIDSVLPDYLDYWFDLYGQKFEIDDHQSESLLSLLCGTSG